MKRERDEGRERKGELEGARERDREREVSVLDAVPRLCASTGASGKQQHIKGSHWRERDGRMKGMQCSNSIFTIQ